MSLMTKLYKFYTIILPNYKMQIYLWPFDMPTASAKYLL